MKPILTALIQVCAEARERELSLLRLERDTLLAELGERPGMTFVALEEPEAVQGNLFEGEACSHS